MKPSSPEFLILSIVILTGALTALFTYWEMQPDATAAKSEQSATVVVIAPLNAEPKKPSTNAKRSGKQRQGHVKPSHSAHQSASIAGKKNI